MSGDFRSVMEARMVQYKNEVLKEQGEGKWRGGCYPHILPEEKWQLNLFEGIRNLAVEEFEKNEIAWHQQKHNLLSGQVLCANLFFPLREHLDVLKPFLSRSFGNVETVIWLDLEYVGPHNEDHYFGEKGGRGQNRTSSDVAITWEDKESDRNLLLLEFKFVESHFGGCSKRPGQDLSLCNSVEKVIAAPKENCYRARVGRKYWDIILSHDSPLRKEALTTEKYCLFRYDFYQLMRNQLLAHCIENDPEAGFKRVDFGVMYHADNEALLTMARPFDGEKDPLKAWLKLLKDPSKSKFHTFTIQEFLRTVDRNLPENLSSWRNFLRQKYGL